MTELEFDLSRAGGAGSPAAAALWAALDVSPDGFAIHRVHRDATGRAVAFTLESINRAGAAPHAAGPADVVGRSLHELLPDAEATGIPAAFRAAADSGIGQELRTEFVGFDWAGTMDLLVARIDDDRIVATWRDVTEQVRSQQILIDAYTRAQAAWDCLYGVLDAVGDAVLLLRVTTGRGAANHAAPDPDGAGRDARGIVARGGTAGAVRIVADYLNATAAGSQDRKRLIGKDLAEINPGLGLDRHLEHVVDLIVAASSDRPGSLRQLVFSDDDGGTTASYSASPAPQGTHAPAFGTDDVEGAESGRGVVLVVRHPTPASSTGSPDRDRDAPRRSGTDD